MLPPNFTASFRKYERPSDIRRPCEANSLPFYLTTRTPMYLSLSLTHMPLKDLFIYLLTYLYYKLLQKNSSNNSTYLVHLKEY